MQGGQLELLTLAPGPLRRAQPLEDPAHTAALTALRERVPELGLVNDEPEHYADDAAYDTSAAVGLSLTQTHGLLAEAGRAWGRLLRFLRARDFHVEQVRRLFEDMPCQRSALAHILLAPRHLLVVLVPGLHADGPVARAAPRDAGCREGLHALLQDCSQPLHGLSCPTKPVKRAQIDTNGACFVGWSGGGWSLQRMVGFSRHNHAVLYTDFKVLRRWTPPRARHPRASGQAPGPGTRARRPVPENPPPTHPFRTHNLSMISDRGHGQHASARGVTAIEHVVVLMEKAIAAMRAVGTTSSKFVIVFHFEGFSWYDCDPRLASAFVSLIGQQYPERLHRLVLVDAPFLFEPTWGLVRGTMPPTRPICTHSLIPSVWARPQLRPVLPEATVQKIVFAKTGAPTLDAVLAEELDDHLAATVRAQIEADKRN